MLTLRQIRTRKEQMIRELKDKMIELRTLELQASGARQGTAALDANEQVERFANLFNRALIATGLQAVYDKPSHGVAEAVQALADANPGANIKGNPDGSFTADVPGLKFPITPPRPTIQFLPHGRFDMATSADRVAQDVTKREAEAAEYTRMFDPEATLAHAGYNVATRSEEVRWSENLYIHARQRVGGSVDVGIMNPTDGGMYANIIIPEAFKGVLADAINPPGLDVEPPEGETVDCGPQPPENAAAMPGYPDRQELEDKLRIIAAIVDQQTAFGTDMADFKRRLQRML
jgi:hypothetical protein